jgi:hypothetical protein
MKKTKFPKFTGKPLIEIPTSIPTVNYLIGDFGKYVHNKIVSKYGANNPFVTAGIVYDNNSGKVKGSRPGYCVAVNEVIREEELITATPADLEKILKSGALDLRGTYEDSALVLRNENEPNSYEAKDLMKQVKARNPKIEMPVVIPLNGLDIVEDKNSKYGFIFRLRENAEIIYAPTLNTKGGSFDSECIYEKTGLPVKLNEKGNRTLYTRSSGLSRLYLDRGLDLDSNGGNVDDSNSDGRVVVVSAEGAAQNSSKQ